MIERQVFVTWWEPSRKLPKNDDIVVMTVSGKAGNRTFDHALMLGNYVDGEGWWFEDVDIDTEELMDSITVHAWCDLEPYGGAKG